LGSPTDAFAVMRQVGIGATNATIASIPVEFNLPIITTPGTTNPIIDVHDFSWTYKKKSYSVDLTLNSALYQQYVNSTKDYSYSGALPDNWREGYYQNFLTAKSGDNTISLIIGQLKASALANNLSSDELVELTVGFIQSIPYDYSRVSDTVKPNYPYETLYRKLGVCSDKVFLGVMLLRNLGYGAAVMDYPDHNHAGIGIECPSQYAVHNSPYCFAETTNFFPIGFVPQGLSAVGVAVKPAEQTIVGQFDHVFDISSLGSVEIYQRTRAKVYQGIINTYQQVNQLKFLENSLTNNKLILDSLKKQVDAKFAQVELEKQKLNDLQAQGQIETYNQLIPGYNILIQEYNDLASSYRVKIETYNTQGTAYNQGVTDLYSAGPAL